MLQNRYLNPTHVSKEEWLGRHARTVAGSPTRDDYARWKLDGEVPLVHVRNPAFSAVGICTSFEELEDWLDSRTDRRPKTLFLVQAADLTIGTGISEQDAAELCPGGAPAVNM